MAKEIYLAGGCFWGCQKYFDMIPGVEKTAVGYANGLTENPTYEQVKHENTGHAEAVHIVYNEKLLTLEELLRKYFQIIDPTAVNRQGEDEGVQYRTGIYYTDSEDAQIAERIVSEQALLYAEPIAVEISPLENYYSAEDYHQKYLDKNPGGYCHIHFD